MIKRYAALMLVNMLLTPAFALQVKSFAENATIHVKLSATDVTRIFIQGDRIKSVKGIKGAYTRENDEKNGEIYVQPTPLYQERAFTMLIQTEKGHHFTLLVTPTFSPSETLMLVSKGVGKVAAKQFEQAAPYELTITHLLKAMKQQQTPEGYAIEHLSHSPSIAIKRGVYLKPMMTYQGLSLRGEIASITNQSLYPVVLDERAFYKPGTRAISLDQIYLSPKQTVTLYRILSHE